MYIGNINISMCGDAALCVGLLAFDVHFDFRLLDKIFFYPQGIEDF